MAMNDLWLKDQEDLEKYGNELMYKINVRNQQPKSGLQFTRVSPLFVMNSDTDLLFAARRPNQSHAQEVRRAHTKPAGKTQQPNSYVSTCCSF